MQDGSLETTKVVYLTPLVLEKDHETRLYYCGCCRLSRFTLCRGHRFGPKPIREGFGGSASVPTPPERVESVPPAAPKRLTFQLLTDVLRQLGYEVEVTGERMCCITVKREDWTLPVGVEVSQGGAKLWLSLRLTTLEGNAQQHVERILKLMATNGIYLTVLALVLSRHSSVKPTFAAQPKGTSSSPTKRSTNSLYWSRRSRS